MDEYKNEKPIIDEQDPLLENIEFPIDFSNSEKKTETATKPLINDVMSKLEDLEDELKDRTDISKFPELPKAMYYGYEPRYSDERLDKLGKFFDIVAEQAKLRANVNGQDKKTKGRLETLSDTVSGMKERLDNKMSRLKSLQTDHKQAEAHRAYMVEIKGLLKEFEGQYEYYVKNNVKRGDEHVALLDFHEDIGKALKAEQKATDSELDRLEAFMLEAHANAKHEKRHRNDAPTQEEPAVEEDVYQEYSEADIVIVRDPYEEQRAQILKCAKELEKAKTRVNSQEYKDLIELMRKVGKGEFKKTEGMSKKEQFAYELSFIGHQTEKYLSHKAKDGVKKNALGKLGAVEAASRTVSECAQLLGKMSLPLNAKNPELPQRLENINPDVDQRTAEIKNEKIGLIPDEADYEDMAKKFVVNTVVKPKEMESIKQQLSDVDTCLRKIIVRSLATQESATYRPIINLRNDFVKNPAAAFQPEKAAPEKQREKSGLVI